MVTGNTVHAPMSPFYWFRGGNRLGTVKPVTIFRAVIKVLRDKARIATRLDDDVLDWFCKQVDDAGGGS